MATRFKIVMVLLTLALAMGCVSPAPLPTATPEPFVARKLDVKIDPKDAATFVLNPSPLGKGGYSQGMVVTIDILPKQGWQVDRWVGPVFNIDGMTAQIEMDSSQPVAVRLKLTTPPTATPTDTPIPPTADPTDTPAPATATPTPTPQVIRVTATPLPTARVIRVTATPMPRTPTPTSTARYHYNDGLNHYRNGRYKQAINAFNNAIRMNMNASYMRAKTYAQLGQYKRAIQYCIGPVGRRS